MRLYSGSTEQFVRDSNLNQISEKLKSSFFNYFRYYPSSGEQRSWENSLRALSGAINEAQLLDHGIILEYQLPQSSKRLDAMICGKNGKGKDNAVIVELKQWQKTEAAIGENEVSTFVGGAHRELLHPSAQVGQYKMYLEDTHTAFFEPDEKGNDPVGLSACSYLHNYQPLVDDPIFDTKFEELLKLFPLYTRDSIFDFIDSLKSDLEGGEGLYTLARVEQSKYRPSKKLMQHVGKVIKGHSGYILLDEQKIVYDKVIALAKRSFHDKQKHAIIIKGGPGTGKSVIAINLMADLLLENYNAHYATGSKAFTETLWKIVGTRSQVQFKYTHNYALAKENEIDVLIVDEAHRIRKVSSNRFTPKHKKSGLLQVEEILKAGKVNVFFIDNDQNVRPNEIGKTSYILENAKKYDCKIHEYDLVTQFRCGGSEAFVNWVSNTLRIEENAYALLDQQEDFDFKIFDSPQSLEEAIREKADQGHTARVTASFCWPWTKETDPEGNLTNDVVIGDYSRPWNAHPNARGLRRDIPKASYWAYDPNGINQVGCVYTAQGFEFDYVGVIFGLDLTYNFDENQWEAHPDQSEDRTVRRSKIT